MGPLREELTTASLTVRSRHGRGGEVWPQSPLVVLDPKRPRTRSHPLRVFTTANCVNGSRKPTPWLARYFCFPVRVARAALA